MFSLYAQHTSDRQALTYLEDLWVARNPTETRAFTIEFVRVFFFAVHDFQLLI